MPLMKLLFPEPVAPITAIAFSGRVQWDIREVLANKLKPIFRFPRLSLKEKKGKVKTFYNLTIFNPYMSQTIPFDKFRSTTSFYIYYTPVK